MPEFLDLVDVATALKRIFKAYPTTGESEWVNVADALGRVTSHSIFADEDLPRFNRSTVDGYAVHASDTFGASDSLPAYLKMIGEIEMGMDPLIKISTEECGLIHTGGKIPEGSDAVVMLEDAQMISSDLVSVYRSVSAGENTILRGEDILAGGQVIPKGKEIGPAEIGGLSGLGIMSIQVVKKPRVGIISTGDELIHPSQKPVFAQVRDINSYSLSSMVELLGGEPFIAGIYPDEFDVIYEGAKKIYNDCDILVITAGSSASTRDLTAQIINKLGPPGVLVHGINCRPGKPTILGVCQNKPVIGLPGNPVSCLVAAMLILKPIVKYWFGYPAISIDPYLIAHLTQNIPSKAGREDWIPVNLVYDRENDQYLAKPIFSKSNQIFSLINADGLMKISADENGVEHGQSVKIFLLK
jgi:molybdopterin molybdotransferase